MGGIAIDIWEKSNFWVNWITKRCQKHNFSLGQALKAPLPLVGLNKEISK